jgi:DNA-binding winged helix-turn-helix (wHTH) protein
MPTKAPKRDVVDSAALRTRAEAVAFGTFRIDRRASQLFDGERAVPLRPKTWAVLLYLAERPKVLVTRDELLDAIWPDVAVTPDTLNKSIGELRLALGDDSRTPRFLETVHRRGFRFIAPRSSIEPTARTSAEVTSAPPTAEVRQAAPACFVGRDAEMRVLADRFAAAQAGDRQIVFVTGAAGAGKTALVDAFLASRAIGERAVPVWIGRAGCVEQHGPQEPYMPVLDALQHLVRPPNVERMIALMRRSAPLWLAQMPWLLGEADAAALRQSLQGIRAERMPREMAALVETLTTDLTLVLVLEDLHWSDPSTVDLLTVLARRRDRARLLVIATYRPADVAVHEHVLGAAVRTLQERDRCVELALPDLTLDAVRGYLDLRFPGHAFPPALAERIHALTDGQPLFVAALVDHLRSRGSILDTTPGWALSVPVDTVDLGVPDDVRRLIEGQFRALSPDERRVLEAASAAGEHIAASIIAAAVGCSADLAEQVCESLARSQRFLQAVGTLAWPDRTRARRYAFTHELHRQVVYSETPDERRTRFHGAIGRALERAQGASVNDLAPQLAAHFARAHDETRTLHYLTVAGARARERFASREALQYFDRALELVDELTDPAERNLRETELRLARGRAPERPPGLRCRAGARELRTRVRPVRRRRQPARRRSKPSTCAGTCMPCAPSARRPSPWPTSSARSPADSTIRATSRWPNRRSCAPPTTTLGLPTRCAP